MHNNLSKRDENKLKKEKKLLKSAYKLFTTKGINNTTINDIVKEAGVAKGTFYLYFNDKYNLLEKIILTKSSIILQEALEKAKQNNLTNFTEEIIFAIDYIINKLKEDKQLLKLVYKNLSLGIFKKAVKDPEEYKEMKEAVAIFNENLVKRGITQLEAEKLLFIILEMSSGVIYTAIVLEEPYKLKEIKPMLYKTIRKIVDV